ncbi:MAG: hypothetical protein KA149_04795 [Chitinophagales bacterium]|nr:hypothetical protein [Chitinophagales bacterium]
MRDLTPIFKVAISQNILWKINEFYGVVELLKQHGFEISHDEGEDNWGTIGVGKLVGYIWQKYPVIFIESKYAGKLQLATNSLTYLSVIEVKDLNGIEFRLDYKDFADYLDEGVNYEAFSAEDLWFGTTSI